MARKSRTAVLKRQREARKAEKQAAKREKRMERETVASDGSQVATADDLAGYGFVGDEEEEQGKSEEPPGARTSVASEISLTSSRQRIGRRAPHRGLRRL